jgi:hypothetical protein
MFRFPVLPALAAALVLSAAAGKEPPPPSGNLTLSPDIPEKAREAVEEAIKDFQEAQKAESGQGGLLREAIRKLTSAGEKAPKSPVPLYYLGIAYQLKNNFPKAKGALERAVQLNPEFHEAIVELADTHVWLKDYPKALSTYDRALQIRPDYVKALDNKGTALVRLGRYREAKESILAAKKIEESPQRDEILKQIEVAIDGPGWTESYSHETENYQILTNYSKKFAEEMGDYAEMINRAYSKVFPRGKKPERKFPIWIYKDRESFHASGVPPGVGGYYSPFFRRLVLFRYPKIEDTLLVLNHEAMHQYLHDYIEEAPQWFNEGLGDYFGAFQPERAGSRMMMIPKPNSWRLRTIKTAIPLNACPPAAELMLMSRREMYNPRMAGIHYAQAWAMVYFIMHGGNSGYRRLLDGYYRALVKGLDIEEAYEATFGKINMDRFDQEWKKFIMNVK